jgi:L-aminopeptidase/D-esterase-like protein
MRREFSFPEVAMKPRARDLGVPLAGYPGKFNAITDVDGVLVGHTTLMRGKNVRTGVTVILPRGRAYDPVFAGWHALNGNGEMTGTTWVEESGFLESPVALTNTDSVGAVRDAVVAWMSRNRLFDPLEPGTYWLLPVVAETYDGFLNDIHGYHVTAKHVFAALDGAAGGRVAEGNVGGGTGMICHGFKGGVGTASRRLPDKQGAHTVGVLVQANHGSRTQLTVAGAPVGEEIPDLLPSAGQTRPAEAGSIIAVVATDAPLLPHQLKRLARRVPLGIGRVGGIGGNSSGDIFIAFSTANPGAADRHKTAGIRMLPNDVLDPLLSAVVQATEEAILNALVAAETLTGLNGHTVHALPHEQLRAILEKYNRLVK